VIDSTLSDGYHLITLAFSNTGRHGVYIEELFVAKPKNEPILVGDYVKNMMKGPGFNDGLLGKPEKKFPLHIEPGFDSRIVIAVPQKSRLDYEKDPSITLAYVLTMLNDPKPREPKEIKVRIRW